MKRAWAYLFLKLAADILFVNISFILAFLLKFQTINLFPALAVYYKPLLLITVLWLVIFNLAGLYKLQMGKVGRLENLFSVSFGIFSAAFFTYLLIIFFYQEASYSREIVIIGSLIAFVLINISRYMIWKRFK